MGPNALLFGRGGTGGILIGSQRKQIGEQFGSFDIGADDFGYLILQLITTLPPETTLLFV